MKNVRVLGREFDGGFAVSGFTIRDNGLTGLDGVDMRSESENIAQNHGEYELPGFLASRIVTISGLCLARSDEELGQFRSALSGLLADGGSAPVMFDYLGIKGWGRAQRVGRPEFEVIIPGSIAEYSLELKFSDPRLYGSVNTFGPDSSVEVNHYGNFTAAPVLTITGSQSGYTVSGPGGRQYVVTKALVAGAPHTIDMATGYLSVGGVVQLGVTPTADTWGVPGGSKVTMSVSGNASIKAAVTDTSA